MSFPYNSFHFAVGPLLAFVLLLVLGGLLRWTFGTQRDHPAPDRDPDGDYGLLREVAVVPTAEAAEILRRRLAAEGVRATVNPAAHGTGRRILVFAGDESDARVVLARQDEPPPRSP